MNEKPNSRSVGLRAALALALCLMTGTAGAGVVSGFLNDPANTALVSSDGAADPVLRSARFGSDDLIARNVAVYELTVTTPGSISFTSFGWAALGAEPYFSLFDGQGLAATFLDSNGISDPSNIDFSLSYSLAAGTYMFSLGVWMNMSFAENNPDADPSLGDGFTALGNLSALGSSYYEIEVVGVNGATFDINPAGIAEPPVPVPEPAPLLLVVTALILLAASMRGRQRRKTNAALGLPRAPSRPAIAK